MHYWVIIQPHNKRGKLVGDCFHLFDYILPGFVPEHVLDMMNAQYVDDELGLCRGCEVSYHCHVIEVPTGRKYCPVLFHDAVNPNWRIEDLV